VGRFWAAHFAVRIDFVPHPEGVETDRRRAGSRTEADAWMPDVVHQLLATDAASDKLGARGISADEAGQLPRNRHVIVRNPAAAGEQSKRRLLIGRTDGGRELTLVIEQTIDPTTWLIVTGWNATAAERNLLGA
jgi:hypothetical protein